MIKINSNIGCSFDTAGNVYFRPYNNPSNSSYEIFITNKNELICEKCIESYDSSNNQLSNIDKDEYDDDDDNDNELSNNIVTGKIVPFTDNTTLRGSIIKQKKDDEIEQNNQVNQIDPNDPNAEYDEDDYEDVVKKDYYNEDIEYNEYLNGEDEDENSDKIYTTPKFSFSSDHKKIKQSEILKLVSDNEEILALYDTLVYEGTPQDASLIFKTKLLNDVAIYRLCIYGSGDIKFRPIGAKETSYKLVLHDDIISLS